MKQQPGDNPWVSWTLQPLEGADALTKQSDFWAVIPAGGAGTRLWPVSRSGQPKFLLPLVNPDRSMIQQTVDRLADICPPGQTLVVCGPAHATLIARQLPELGDAQIIIEPSPKGSGPAIAIAAAIIARHSPSAVMGSFAADHDVRDLHAFGRAVRNAITAAQNGWLVTIGIQPTRAETGYGYIEWDEAPLPGAGLDETHRVLRFVEKPDLQTATAYVESKRFLWNASMFVWRVDTFLEELERYMPDVATSVHFIASAWGTSDQDTVMGEVWSTLTDVTIDNGLLEVSDRIAVVPAEMGWSDVGDWHGLGALLDHDERGNTIHGDIIDADCTNNVVWSDTPRMISLLGLNNIIVVDTEDALLVAERGHAQLVRSTVSRLKDMKRTSLL